MQNISPALSTQKPHMTKFEQTRNRVISGNFSHQIRYFFGSGPLYEGWYGPQT